MLLAALVRSGALAPDRLLHGSRSILANANGAVVLATLFAAAAQLLGMLTPRKRTSALFRRRLPVRSCSSIRWWRSRIGFAAAQRRGDPRVRARAQVRRARALSGPSGSRTARVLVALFDGRDVRDRSRRSRRRRAPVPGLLRDRSVPCRCRSLAAARPFSGSTALRTCQYTALSSNGTVYANDTTMAVFSARKTGCDVLEHAMQGMRTSENRGQVVTFHADPGIIGMRSSRPHGRSMTHLRNAK
jgi:hypothetical protein